MVRCLARLLLLVVLTSPTFAQSFQTQPAFPTGGTGLHDIEVADFDNDGDRDLIVSNRFTQNLSLLLNNGNATFTTQTVGGPQHLFTPGPLAVADFNGDGSPDVAVGSLLAGVVSVYLGDGAGGLTHHSQVLPTAAPVFSVGDLVATDINSDGFVDLVVNPSNPSFVIMHGNGVAGFASQVAAGTSLTFTDEGMLNCAVADVDLDGAVDLLLPCPLVGTVGIYRGTGAGGFTPLQSWFAFAAATALTVADLDGDSWPDAVVADPLQGVVGVYKNVAGMMVLTQSISSWAPGDTEFPARLATHDLTADGLVDLIVADWNGNKIDVLAAATPGSFAAPVSINLADAPMAFAIDDFDGNGSTDIATALLSGNVQVLLGAAGANQFRRGDANQDGAVHLADAVRLLAYLFVPGSPALVCDDAGDADDDSVVNVGDVVTLLNYLFVPACPPLLPPSNQCGVDPTDDALGCSNIACP